MNRKEIMCECIYTAPYVCRKCKSQYRKTEWLDVMLDGRMVEINGAGKTRKKKKTSRSS